MDKFEISRIEAWHDSCRTNRIRDCYYSTKPSKGQMANCNNCKKLMARIWMEYLD